MMRQVEAISYLLGLNPESNGSNFNWFAETHSGILLSLYYDVDRNPADLHWVEVMDRKRILGLPTDDDGLVGINIKHLPRYFKQESD